MESSEEDAGAATVASRRASAREKDVGRSEDGGAGVGDGADLVGRPPSAAASYEEALDADSVPSPSNDHTSTEALLDMIDEIVDSPGPSRRRSHASQDPVVEDSQPPEPEKPPDTEPLQSVVVDNSVPEVASKSDLQNQNTSHNASLELNVQASEVSESERSTSCPTEPSTSNVNNVQHSQDVCIEQESSQNQGEVSKSVESPGACSSVNIEEVAVSTVAEEAISVSNTEPLCARPLDIPSSSEVTVHSESDVVQSVSETGRCDGQRDCQAETSERTLKCVTSSDSRDSVTVESAESTSAENVCDNASSNVIDSRALRKRLVRPTQSRSDSMVSSTVDSRSINVHTTQESSDSITKDVSSSSDAVPHVHGDVKPEEIRVSDVSICKAETSSPPKKIKLVRHKFQPTMQSLANTLAASSNEMCQSTSSDNTTSRSVTSNISPEPDKIVEKLEAPDQLVSAELIQSAEPSQEAVPEVISQNKINPETEVTGDENPTVQCEELVIEAKPETEVKECISGSSNSCQDHSVRQVPKLTIKLGGKHTEGPKSPVPKLTIKPIKPPSADQECQEVSGQIPSVTKLNIKPIPKPTEKVNDVHRKSSSSDISESDGSENDDGTSDQTSNSDAGAADVVPKVTIKLGKPGTDSEGKFYTQQNAPKLKGLHSENEERDASKLKLIINQVEEKQDKVPKLTIKTKGKSEGQPLSPKLTIKPLKAPDIVTDRCESPSIPKITIKPVVKTDSESSSKTPKKLCVSESSESIPMVTKLNIKPILKPTDCTEKCEVEDKFPVVSKLNIKPVLKPVEVSKEPEEKVPVVSKLNIKPIVKPITTEAAQNSQDNVPVVSKLNIKPIVKPLEIGESSNSIDDKLPVISKLNIKPVVKPKDNNIDSSTDDIPKITKLNIKPLKNPDAAVEEKHENTNTVSNSIHVTRLNIKPVVKPSKHDPKESKNQSSETGNSSDENNDQIPVVTKLNIKPIIRPNDTEESEPQGSQHENIPVVTKLNIKPLVRPEGSKSPVSPKKVTKLNIKPIVKPEEDESNITEGSPIKNPPLLMKINRKAVAEACSEKQMNHKEDKVHHFNNVSEDIPIVSKLNIKPVVKPIDGDIKIANIEQVVMNCKSSTSQSPLLQALQQNHVSDLPKKSEEETKLANENPRTKELHDKLLNMTQTTSKSSLQNCTLLKKLLETKKDGLDTRLEVQVNDNHSQSENVANKPSLVTEDVMEPSKGAKLNSKESTRPPKVPHHERVDMSTQVEFRDIHKATDNFSQPLEINTSDKTGNQSSGQDSPRIILKINKTDHGTSAKLITEDQLRPATPTQSDTSKNTQQNTEKRRNAINIRKKGVSETPPSAMGKRLRSSRVVESTEKSPEITVTKRNVGKKTAFTEVSSSEESKVPELSVLDAKRLKLGQLLANTSLTITPVPADLQKSPTKSNLEVKHKGKVNHTILNNDTSKNGNSKLHNILSNLQAKQAQALAFNKVSIGEKNLTHEEESNASTRSSDVVEIIPIDNSLSAQDTTISDSSSKEIVIEPVPLETAKVASESTEVPKAPEILMTPQPKKRGRPRKVPLSEGAKPPPRAPTPPPAVPALDDRPTRSLRLSRERPPPVTPKPRGRGRGRGGSRGGKRAAEQTPPEPESPTKAPETVEEQSPDSPPMFIIEKPKEDIDPTSSRIKLPRMTEALDKMPSNITTPLTSRRRISSTEMNTFSDTPELKVVLNAMPSIDSMVKSPEPVLPLRGPGSRGGRGSRGRGRGTPRGRGRGVNKGGGGRGVTYMKETMGIYGRVCGSATTTVQLFEEETCMMDDNATPAKPSHILDEDSQSSVKSLTNESSKMKRSKFDDLFDSNKVWTAADVKEYVWPTPEKCDPENPSQIMMIQEQVAMFLGVKSFKRRYPELKRRPVGGEERDYILSNNLVAEALCDLGVTAVEAGEVLDIMLSDYPHKYEEYRSYQRKKQTVDAVSAPAPEAEVKVETKIEMKADSKAADSKETPKVDLEKTRQELIAAAIQSAAEWNTRMNALRQPACADLSTLSIHRRRPPVTKAPVPRVAPVGGFYPHALLPGQYQHYYRAYTPEQLRYFPINTVMAAPPAPPSPPPPASSESDGESSTSQSSDESTSERPAKRKKLTKTKRNSGAGDVKEEVREEVDTCRSCGLRLEANRRQTHERFLVCAHCNAKLHPGCVDLGPDTIRKCREYPWQCAECKTCGACSQPADDDKMLFCDLCDRGFHIYCQGLDSVPSGRWHCAECAVCKSCGTRDPDGGPPAGSSSAPSTPATPSGSVTVPGGGQWHHQTKRGPGGHKVYSHSLCTPCASKSKRGTNKLATLSVSKTSVAETDKKAYRIGRYCPLCDRSFIGPKGTMQLVICKLCDRQHHQDCVRQTVSTLNVLDYTCGECRRGGITSRSAAVRVAPRTIATLFMAKRRFNKYAHKQYLKTKAKGVDTPTDVAEESCDPAPDDASDSEHAQEMFVSLEGTSDTLGATDASEGATDTAAATHEGGSKVLAGDPLGNAVQDDPVDPMCNAVQDDPVDPMCNAVQDDPVDPLCNAVQDDPVNPMGNAEQHDSGDPLGNAVQDDTGDPLGNAVQDDTGDPLGNAVQDDTGDPLGNPVQDDTGDPLGNAVQDATGDPLDNAVQDDTTIDAPDEAAAAVAALQMDFGD